MTLKYRRGICLLAKLIVSDSETAMVDWLSQLTRVGGAVFVELVNSASSARTHLFLSSHIVSKVDTRSALPGALPLAAPIKDRNQNVGPLD